MSPWQGSAIAILAASFFLVSCTSSRYGTVSDVSGAPIEGAIVSFTQRMIIPRPVDATSAELWSARRTTDVGGQYEVPWWVRVEAAGADGKMLIIPFEADVSMHVQKLGYEYAPREFGWIRTIDVILQRVPEAPEELRSRPSKPKVRTIHGATIYDGRPQPESN